MTECQFGCGKDLTWDKSRRSDSGKMIPIEKSTNEPHNCQIVLTTKASQDKLR